MNNFLKHYILFFLTKNKNGRVLPPWKNKSNKRGRMNMELMEAKEVFKSLFGAEAEDLFTAAGRINVIGEHIDYCGGKVFPAALNLRCNVYGRKTGSNVIRIALKGIEGISITRLSPNDVVRHPLVQKIIVAYEKYEQRKEKREVKD